MEAIDNSKIFIKKSKFTGSTFGYFGIRFLSSILITISLGLLYPFVVCWKLKWISKYTIIDNKKMGFDGNSFQLFGKYIIWLLLSIITFGIYYIVKMSLNLEKWRVKHTYIIGIERTESKFTGSAIGLFGVKLLTRFVTIITLGFGSFWAHCYIERWYAKHTYYNGYQLSFNGRAIEYFGKKIIWLILTIITLGIYYFFLSVKSYKWTISHTEMPLYPNEVTVLKKDGTLALVDQTTNLKLAKNPNYDESVAKIKKLNKEKKDLVGSIKPSNAGYIFLILGVSIPLINLLLGIIPRSTNSSYGPFRLLILIGALVFLIIALVRRKNKIYDDKIVSNKIIILVATISMVLWLWSVLSTLGYVYHNSWFSAISIIVNISLLSLLILSIISFVKNINIKEKAYGLKENEDIINKINSVNNEIEEYSKVSEYIEI